MNIIVAAPVRTRSGYGARSRDIVKALIANEKYDVKVIPLRWGNTPETALDSNNEEDRKILDRLINPKINENNRPDIFIHITIPNEFEPVGKFNIGITAGIETTQCKAEWIEGCNKMDLVLVSSNHSKNVFESIKYDKKDQQGNVLGIVKLEKPMEVLFEGIDLDVYNKKNIVNITNKLEDIEEEFCFLFVGHWLQGNIGEDRKDIGMLIKTFLETFVKKAERNRPALVLKVSHAGFSETELYDIEKKINHIILNVEAEHGTNLPSIYIVYGDMTDTEMNSLYHHPKIKTMISFSKGEGFGRPLLEFMTTGKPVMTSNWSGPVDFVNPDYNILLPGRLTKVPGGASNDWIIRGSEWFTVDYKFASMLMNNIIKNYKQLSDISRKNTKHVSDNFSLPLMAEKLYEYIDKQKSLQPEPIDKMKITLPKLTKV